MNDLVRFLDRFIEADGRRVAAQCALDEAQRLEQAARPRCGNCYWWMKSRDCPQERNVNGRNHGPGSDGLPCSKFQEEARVEGLRTKAAEHIARAAAIRATPPSATPVEEPDHGE